MNRIRQSKWYPWVIVLGVSACGMLTTCLCNTCALYLMPVMTEFGWSQTQAALYMTIFAWVAAAMQPLCGKLFEKCNALWLMLVVNVAFVAAYIWSASFTHLWQWNVFGVIYGITAGFFMYLVAPILITRWFAKNRGMAIASTGVVLGLVGVVWMPLVQNWITNYGWQVARSRSGIVVGVIVVVLTLLCIRNSPEEMGVKAWGADEAEEEAKNADGKATPEETGMTRKEALKTSAFYFIAIAAFISCLTPSLNQQLSAYSSTVPIGVGAGAIALSIISLSGFVRSPIVGWMTDKFGAIATNCVSCLMAAVGLFMIILDGGRTAWVFYVGIALFSMCFVPLTSGNPLMVTEVFGTKDFSNIYSIITTIVLVSGGVAQYIFAAMYDQFGSYVPTLIFVTVLLVIQAIMSPAIIAANKKAKKVEKINQ